MACDLYLVRHAEAIPRGSWDPDDHRWLTPEGRRRFYQAARCFAHKVGKRHLDAILTSPLPRAVMTAELLARALRMRGPVEVYGELGPDQPAEAALSLLTRLWRRNAGARQQKLGMLQRRVALVGHEPMLSQLLLQLCGERAKIEKEKLAKGAIAALRAPSRDNDLEDIRGRARLRYLIEP